MGMTRSYVTFFDLGNHDREFQSLPEFIITCSKSYPYTYKKVEIKRKLLPKKVQFFRLLEEVTVVILEFFFGTYII